MARITTFQLDTCRNSGHFSKNFIQLEISGAITCNKLFILFSLKISERRIPSAIWTRRVILAVLLAVQCVQGFCANTSDSNKDNLRKESNDQPNNGWLILQNSNL